MTSIQACSPPGGSGESAAGSGVKPAPGSTGGTVVDMGFAAFVVGMVVFGLQRDHVELAVTDATFGHQGVGKLPDVGRRTFEDHAFQAVVVVEVAVQGGHGQVVVVVLQAGQPFGQFALVVVVDVGQVGDAVAGRRFALAVALDGAADQVAHRFRAVAVAAGRDQLIELAGQGLVQRNGEALHVLCSLLNTPSNPGARMPFIAF